MHVDALWLIKYQIYLKVSWIYSFVSLFLGVCVCVYVFRMFVINRHWQHDQLSSGDSRNFVVVKSDLLVWQKKGSPGGSIFFVWCLKPTPTGATRERAGEETNIEWDRRNISLYTSYYSAFRRELSTKNKPNKRVVIWKLLGPLNLPSTLGRNPLCNLLERWTSSSAQAPHTTESLLLGKIQILEPQPWRFWLGRAEVRPLTLCSRWFWCRPVLRHRTTMKGQKYFITMLFVC